MTDYSEASEALESPAEETAETSSEHTFYLPSDCAEALRSKGVNLEPGTTIPFQVVGKDSEGNIEVGYQSKDEDDWGKDLENNMPASVGGNMTEEA